MIPIVDPEEIQAEIGDHLAKKESAEREMEAKEEEMYKKAEQYRLEQIEKFKAEERQNEMVDVGTPRHRTLAAI